MFLTVSGIVKQQEVIVLLASSLSVFLSVNKRNQTLFSADRACAIIVQSFRVFVMFVGFNSIHDNNFLRYSTSLQTN